MHEDDDIIVPLVLLSAMIIFFCISIALFLNRKFGCFGGKIGQETEFSESEITTEQTSKAATTFGTTKNRKRSLRIVGEPEP